MSDSRFGSDFKWYMSKKDIFSLCALFNFTNRYCINNTMCGQKWQRSNWVALSTFAFTNSGWTSSKALPYVFLNISLTWTPEIEETISECPDSASSKESVFYPPPQNISSWGQQHPISTIHNTALLTLPGMPDGGPEFLRSGLKVILTASVHHELWGLQPRLLEWYKYIGKSLNPFVLKLLVIKAIFVGCK